MGVMEKGENIDLGPNTPAEIDEASLIDDFQSTSTGNQVDRSESPMTSANANKQKTITNAVNNVKANLQSDELNESNTDGNASSLDCPICLQACIHPARLPCGHIFCFLCIKGVAYKNQRCAMCRREIPAEFLDRPQLVFKELDEKVLTKCSKDGYQWFYEGRNGGWWEYDKRSSEEIEEVYGAYIQASLVDLEVDSHHEMLISGTIYSIDFINMVQFPKNAPNRRRKIHRAKHMHTKGVAGIHYCWWQYDVRTSQDIEDAFEKGEKSCTILVAGYVYSVDLETMVQQRQNEPTRCRRVKRDLATMPKKGIAGLRLEGNTVPLDNNSASSTLISLQEGREPAAYNANLDNLVLSHDFASLNATGTSILIPLDNLHDHQRSAETTDLYHLNRLIELSNRGELPGNASSIINTVQNNTQESQHQFDDEFEESLTNLQLMMQSSDVFNSTQDESSERGERREITRRQSNNC